MSFTARPLSTNALYQGVTQVANGFAIGEVLRFNGTLFVDASADTEANAEVVGMVSYINNMDSFYLTQEGFVSGITTQVFVPGTLYYLDPNPLNAGLLTATKPSTVGQIELPCFVAYTADSGFFFANVGDLIQSGSLFNWTVVNANTPMVVNNGYLVNGGASIDLTLPLTASVGDIIRVATLGTNGVSILQNAGQSINLVDLDTTVGVGGRLDLLVTNAVLQGSLELLCTVADTNFKVISGNGNWDVI